MGVWRGVLERVLRCSRRGVGGRGVGRVVIRVIICRRTSGLYRGHLCARGLCAGVRGGKGEGRREEWEMSIFADNLEKFIGRAKVLRCDTKRLR